MTFNSRVSIPDRYDSSSSSIALGQQDNVGEKPIVIYTVHLALLHTNRQSPCSGTKQNEDNLFLILSLHSLYLIPGSCFYVVHDRPVFRISIMIIDATSILRLLPLD